MLPDSPRFNFRGYVVALSALAALHAALAIPTETSSLEFFRESRPLRETQQELLRNDPTLKPKHTNETFEARANRIRKLAVAGDPIGQFGLSILYADGLGVPKNTSEAAAWCRKAAENGLPLAQTCLGEMYDKGDGVPLAAVQAVRW